MDASILEIVVKLGLFMVPFLFAISFHEFSHGWVAKQKGDNTAEILGRLTLNPVAHMDILGTLIVPSMALIFGLAFYLDGLSLFLSTLEILKILKMICFGLRQQVLFLIFY